MDPRTKSTKLQMEDDEDNTGWIVTFSDLMTLLLVFFVLLYSISTLNEAKFKKAMTSIQISLGEKAPAVRLIDLMNEPAQKSKVVSLEDLSGMRSRELDMVQRIREFIEKRGLAKNIGVSLENGKVVIRITGTVLFKSGIAMLNDKAPPIMNEISEIVNEFKDFKVNIKGHTDNMAIATRQFPSNWELSAVRATTVLRYLIEKGISADRLTATGYAELLPLVPNNTEENRQNNRRVEFVLEKENR
ncbi:MAG: OmpA family protein [Deltaproteobacteria bacterium]|nr:OmpA family protein [Deltaproteobacteria bacterium]